MHTHTHRPTKRDTYTHARARTHSHTHTHTHTHTHRDTHMHAWLISCNKDKSTLHGRGGQGGGVKEGGGWHIAKSQVRVYHVLMA